MRLPSWLLGISFFAMGAASVAMIVLATGRSAPGENEDAARIWAEKLASQGPDASEATLRHVYSIRPEAELLALLGSEDWDQAQAAKEALWAIWWLDFDIETLAQAEEVATLLNEGRNRHALIIAEHFWGAAPENSDLLLLRGRSQLGLGLYDLGKTSLLKAIEMSPNHWPSLQTLAVAAIQNQDRETAGEALLKLKSLIPAHPGVDTAQEDMKSTEGTRGELPPGLGPLNALPREFAPPEGDGGPAGAGGFRSL